MTSSKFNLKMHSIMHLFLLLNPYLLSNAITVTNPEDLPQISSLGVFYEIENGQLLYEATAPIIYTVRLPNWLHFLVLSEKVQNCSARTGSLKAQPSSSKCEIFTAFHKIEEVIRSSLQTVPLTFPSVTEESTWGLSCNYISKHFSSSFITPEIAQKYLSFLRSCSDKVIVEEPLIDNYAKLPDAELFQQYDQLWTSTLFSRFDESSSSDNLNLLLEAVETGEVESILSTGITNFLTEAIRWNMALLKCGIGQIPDSVISPERFHKSLLELNASADVSDFRFVIPPKEAFLPVYFKSEFLTDCTILRSTFMTENGNSHQNLDLIVRTLVPITRKGTDWKHVSVKTFPFVNRTKIVVYPEFPLAIQAENYKFIFDNSSKILFTSDAKLCDTTKPGFCRVPQIWDSRRVVRSNCPVELLSGQLHLNTTSKCNRKVQVSALEFPGMPFIVQDGSHTVYLTGIRDESVSFDVSVTCQRDGSQRGGVYYYTFPEEGALKIELACGCHLQITKLNNAVIKPELGLGCNSKLDVSIVLPI